VKVCPAIVIDPLRPAPVFAATEYPTEPLPVPVLPEVMLIQPSLLAAAQPHPVPAVTLTLPVPGLAGNEALVGEIE
jgi:hypothetical protein